MNKRRARELIILLVSSLLLFSVAVTIVNSRSNTQIERKVDARVAEINRALCDLFRFSIIPGPTPPQPKVEPQSEFGKQLAEYNRIQAERQSNGRAKVEAAIKQYC